MWKSFTVTSEPWILPVYLFICLCVHFCSSRKKLHVNVFCHISARLLSVSETAIALRPFLFSVHPDLFGKFPKEQVRRNVLACYSSNMQHWSCSIYVVLFLVDEIISHVECMIRSCCLEIRKWWVIHYTEKWYWKNYRRILVFCVFVFVNIMVISRVELKDTAE